MSARNSRRRSSKVNRVTRDYIMEGSFLNFNNDGQTTMKSNVNIFILYKLLQDYKNKSFGNVEYGILQTRFTNYNIPKKNDTIKKAKKYLLDNLSDPELISLDIDADLKRKWESDINDKNNQKKSSKKLKSLV